MCVFFFFFHCISVIYFYTHVCTYVCMYVYIYVCMCVYVDVCIICKCLLCVCFFFLPLYVCHVFLYKHIHTYTCVCTHTHVHRCMFVLCRGRHRESVSFIKRVAFSKEEGGAQLSLCLGVLANDQWEEKLVHRHMYICNIYVYIHTCTHVHTCIHMYTYIHTYMYTYNTYTYIHRSLGGWDGWPGSSGCPSPASSFGLSSQAWICRSCRGPAIPSQGTAATAGPMSAFRFAILRVLCVHV